MATSMKEILKEKKKALKSEMKELEGDIEELLDEERHIILKMHQTRPDLINEDARDDFSESCEKGLKLLDSHVAFDDDFKHAKNTPCAEALDILKEWKREFDLRETQIDENQQRLKQIYAELNEMKKDPEAYYKKLVNSPPLEAYS